MTTGIFNTITAAALGLGLATAALAEAESSDPIKLTLNEWTGQVLTTHIAGELLGKMGYNVEYVTAGYFPQMTALQDNTVTAALEIWTTNIADAYDKAIDTGNDVIVNSNGTMRQRQQQQQHRWREQLPQRRRHHHQHQQQQQ